MADGFLGRWSRRKLDAKEGRPLEADPVVPATVPEATAAPDKVPAKAPVTSPGSEATPPSPPTMDDVRALTPASDFSRFTGSQVAPDVKNAAMKKLFADPHFNVMDGLDIYIDDYGKPDPMPESMLRSLVSAQALGLFREDKTASRPEENPEGGPANASDATSGDPLTGSTPQIVAQSGPPESLNHPASDPAACAPDADPDLRLQQDPAPGPQGPREGAQ